MSLCFICDKKLQSERTRVCSSITPHTNTPYPEKIAGMLGEEFVVIVTPKDEMCMKCTSLLKHLDKCDNDAKLIKNAMMSFIQTQYGILPPDQAVKNVEVVNGQLMTEEQLKQRQFRVPNPTIAATITTAAIVTPITTPLILLKTQQPQQQQQQQESSNKTKIYKCAFCAFQSKELGHVRFHMRVHGNKTKPEKPIVQAAAKTLIPVQQQKKLLYKCQICSETFDSRVNCLDHIKKEHNQLTTSTSNRASKSEGYADVREEKKTENAGNGEETENSQEDTTAQKAKSVKSEREDEEDTAVLEQKVADQETLGSVKKEVSEDNASVENK